MEPSRSRRQYREPVAIATPASVLRVSVEQRDGILHFSIRDDGAGGAIRAEARI
jgi:hypothetical protein